MQVGAYATYALDPEFHRHLSDFKFQQERPEGLEETDVNTEAQLEAKLAANAERYKREEQRYLVVPAGDICGRATCHLCYAEE